MKLAVVTDSTAKLPESIINHPDLYVIPIPVILDGTIYNEGVDIDAQAYYPLLKNSKEFPTTSQPAMGEMLALYDELAEKGYTDVINIHLSGGISGFVTNLQAMSQEIAHIKVHVFDSLITSMPMGHMVEVVLDDAAAGQDIPAIFAKLTEIRDETFAYLIVDDLNNLVRGGRLTNGAAIVGTLLKIKPILTFVDGKIVVHEKIRSSKKAFQRAEDLVIQKEKELGKPVEFYVIHANHLAMAQELAQELEAKNPGIKVGIGEFGPVVGTHLGEKAIGFAISPK